jgi:hypothetical protein
VGPPGRPADYLVIARVVRQLVSNSRVDLDLRNAQGAAVLGAASEANEAE